METYKQKVKCGNCDHMGQIEIPKGEVAADQPCPNCGNQFLSKYIEPPSIVLG